VKFTKTAAVAAGAGLVAVGLLATGPATADPSGTPTYRDLAGMGSDTTERVMNALAEVVTISSTKVIASYDATGSATVKTKLSGCDTVTRVNGSSAGRNALQASLAANAGAGDGCLDFARSSSAMGTYSSSIDMSWIPFATDSTSVAVRADGDVAREWTLDDVKNVFKCVAGYEDVKPVLPQTGSGSRASWLSTIGVTEGQITGGSYPCLTGAGTETSRSYVQENDARALKVDEMMPFSVGLFNVQQSGVVSDLTGNAVLAQINGKSPQAATSGFAVSRKLYNIIPTSKEGTAPWSTVFVGGGALICAEADTIAKQGFTVAADCGTVETRS